MIRAAALVPFVLFVGLGGLTAVAVAGADDPPAVTVTETVVQTETVAVDRRLSGHGVWFWHRRAHSNWQEARQARQAVRRAVGAPYGTHWLERAFLCLRSHEASWTGTDSATGRTYFGGLQMDRTFQRTYGGEFYRAFGTADRWPISVQIAVGIRAYLAGRGFGPWPNTRRACGL